MDSINMIAQSGHRCPNAPVVARAERMEYTDTGIIMIPSVGDR